MIQRFSLLLWLLLFCLATNRANAQVCSDFPPLGIPAYTGTATGTFQSLNCSGIWSCEKPVPLSMTYALSPVGCNPTTTTCSAEVAIEARFPGNFRSYTPTMPAPPGWQTPGDSLVKLLWVNGHGQDPGSCGSPLGKITNEEGLAKMALSFSCAAYQADPDLYRFTLSIETCQTATGCPPFAKTVEVDFAIGSALCPEPPPEDDCSDDVSCKICKTSGGGIGAGGASAAGGGSTAGGLGTGAGALLRYKAGRPSAVAWLFGVDHRARPLLVA